MSELNYDQIRKAVRSHPWVKDVAEDLGIPERRVYRAVKGSDLYLLRMIHDGRLNEQGLVNTLLQTNSIKQVAKMLLVTPQYISQFRPAGIQNESVKEAS